VSSIRPIERADLEALFERTMRSGRPEPPPGARRLFERTLLDNPWADSEIPSLVYKAGDGRILGFIGSRKSLGSPTRYNTVRADWT
jgi:hypothetical protein